VVRMPGLLTLVPLDIMILECSRRFWGSYPSCSEGARMKGPLQDLPRICLKEISTQLNIIVVSSSLKSSGATIISVLNIWIRSSVKEMLDYLRAVMCFQILSRGPTMNDGSNDRPFTALWGTVGDQCSSCSASQHYQAPCE
jgi:hypothetical protein